MPKSKIKPKPESLESVGLQLPAALYLNIRLHCVSAGITIRSFFIDALKEKLTGNALPKAKEPNS